MANYRRGQHCVWVMQTSLCLAWNSDRFKSETAGQVEKSHWLKHSCKELLLVLIGRKTVPRSREQGMYSVYTTVHRAKCTEHINNVSRGMQESLAWFMRKSDQLPTTMLARCRPSDGLRLCLRFCFLFVVALLSNWHTNSGSTGSLRRQPCDDDSSADQSPLGCQRHGQRSQYISLNAPQARLCTHESAIISPCAGRGWAVIYNIYLHTLSIILRPLGRWSIPVFCRAISCTYRRWLNL